MVDFVGCMWQKNLHERWNTPKRRDYALVFRAFDCELPSSSRCIVELTIRTAYAFRKLRDTTCRPIISCRGRWAPILAGWGCVPNILPAVDPCGNPPVFNICVHVCLFMLTPCGPGAIPPYPFTSSPSTLFFSILLFRFSVDSFPVFGVCWTKRRPR